MNPKDLASAEILLQDWLEEGVRLFSADAPPQADIAYLERWEKILIRLLYHQQSLFVESADDPQLQKTAHAFSSFLSRHAGYRLELARKISQRFAHRQSPGELPRRLRRLAADAAGRGLFIVLTRRCQLRCGYCRIDEYSGDLAPADLSRGIDLLLRSAAPSLRLHFFGGEPLLRFDLLKKGVSWTEKRRLARNKSVSYAVTTNALLLDDAKLAFLRRHDFIVEASYHQPPAASEAYQHRLLRKLELLRDSRVPYYVVMTVRPEEAPDIRRHFIRLAEQGHHRIQISTTLGVLWERQRMTELLQGLDAVRKYTAKHPGIELMNLSGIRREPMLLNAQPMMDSNGDLCLQLGLFFKRARSLDLKWPRDGDFDAQIPTPFDTFRRLTRCFGSEHKQRELSRILLNNITLGWLIGRAM